MAESLSSRDLRLLLRVVDETLPAHEQAAAEARLADARGRPRAGRAPPRRRRVARPRSGGIRVAAPSRAGGRDAAATTAGVAGTRRGRRGAPRRRGARASRPARRQPERRAGSRAGRARGDRADAAGSRGASRTAGTRRRRCDLPRVGREVRLARERRAHRRDRGPARGHGLLPAHGPPDRLHDRVRRPAGGARGRPADARQRRSTWRSITTAIAPSPCSSAVATPACSPGT